MASRRSRCSRVCPRRGSRRPPPSSERAQEQPFPAGSPFALLPGFKIERVTPAEKTESYIVVTFDPQGRPVVSQSSSGAGSSPRVLLDENKDGIYEGEKIVAEMLNTCHGLFYATRTTLYGDCRGEVPGDPPPPAEPQFGRGQQGRGAAAAPGAPGAPGAAPQQGGGGRGQNQPPARGVPGFYKLEDTNGDDVMDRIERINGYAAAGMGDHGPHAIRRGPDGSIMFLIGNNTYVGSRTADGQVNDAAVDTEASPNWNNVEERQFLPQFNDPRFGNSTRIGVHSTVWRLQPNNKYSLFFSGMRNPYDFAFNLAGEAFTFDSDMEWDVNAPWYREVRTVHMIPGGDGGYRNGTGKFQDEYFDTIPALRHLRRGSPVGVEFYQSYAYPEKYFDNLFEADWSRGRLLYTALTPSGATYTGREDLAEFVHGEPMPITDLEVGPDGNIYLTTGGAAGQGGLYKVSWTGAKPAQPDMTGILAVVRQPQPLSSWAWDAIEKVKASMGASFGAELEKLARSSTALPRDRSRALLEMQRHGAAPNAALLQALLKDRQADVRAAAAYVAGLHTSDAAKAVAAAALKDTNALVQRRGAEALVRQGMKASAPPFAPIGDIYALLRSPDRFVRYSGRVALEHTPKDQWVKLVMAETNVVALTEGLVAIANTTPEPQAQSELRPVFEKLLTLMQRATLTPDEKIRVLRAFEVAVAQSPSGVDPEIKKQVYAALVKQLPSAPPAGAWVPCTNQTGPRAECSQFLLAHHLAKVLAYTGEPDVIGRILAIVPEGDEDQPGQIDLMYSLRVIDTGWTRSKSSRSSTGSPRPRDGGAGRRSPVTSTRSSTRPSTRSAPTKSRWLTRRRRCSRRSPRTWRRHPDPAAAGRGGGRGRGPQVPLDRQERFDNLVFPRGGGPGSLAGRGGSPNAAEGGGVFRETCAQCHRYGTVGKDFAPDLTRVAERLQRRDILRSIFFPNEKVDPKYTTTVLALKDGKTVRGLVGRETGQNVVVKTVEEPQTVTVAKSQIAKRTDRGEDDHAGRHRRQGHRRRRARRDRLHRHMVK